MQGLQASASITSGKIARTSGAPASASATAGGAPGARTCGSGICPHYRVRITCKEMMMMAVYYSIVSLCTRQITCKEMMMMVVCVNSSKKQYYCFFQKQYYCFFQKQ
jgi:hypothetical protein